MRMQTLHLDMAGVSRDGNHHSAVARKVYERAREK